MERVFIKKITRFYKKYNFIHTVKNTSQLFKDLQIYLNSNKIYITNEKCVRLGKFVLKNNSFLKNISF
jgi:hypothetical protein